MRYINAILCYQLIFVLNPSASIWLPKNKKQTEVCRSTNCDLRGRLYLANLNEYVSPCDNFFDFVCGNWDRGHPGPRYAAQWTVANLLNKHTMEVLRQILMDEKNLPPRTEYKIAKLVFDTCTQIPEYPRREAPGLAVQILKIGRHPRSKLWDLHNAYLKLTGESPFFGYLILASTFGEKIPVLVFTVPGSAYGAIYHDSHWKSSEETAYTTFLQLVITKLYLPNAESEKQLKERIKKLFKFRRALQDIIQKNKLPSSATFEATTVETLKKIFDIGGMTYTGQFPWDTVSYILLRNLPKQHVATRNIVAVLEPTYFSDLIDLLRKTPEDILAFHVELFFVERHIEFTEEMFKLLKATSTESYTLANHIRVDNRPRWEECIENYNIPQTLDRLYIYKRFPKSHSQITRDIIDKLVAAIKEQVKQSSWLNLYTRQKIEEKLDTLETWIGFPPWYNNVTIKPPADEEDQRIMTPNASFDFDKNLLYIHATMMTSPVFDSHLPIMYNLAGAGVALGHELYHMMQDCGGYEIEFANKFFPASWWPYEMQKKCMLRKVCFVAQYNALTTREFKERYNLNPKVDTTISFTENFPDVMGFDAAYNAFKKEVERNKDSCQTLPLFEDYSCEQMFFIAFANVFCGRHSKTGALHILNHMEHSLRHIRVNGVVSNNKHFAKVFDCSVGSPMNPKKKCNIWE